MKNLLFTLSLAFPFSLFSQTSIIKIDVDRTIGEIDPKIYGLFTGKAESSLLNVASLDESFTFDKQEQYKPATKKIKVKGNTLSCSFPAHSFTQTKVRVKK